MHSHSSTAKTKQALHQTNFRIWQALRKHPLLVAFDVPESGGGVLFLLKALTECLQKINHSEHWQQECIELTQSIKGLGLAYPEMATPHEKNDRYWGLLDTCLTKRRKVSLNDRVLIDQALGYLAVHHAAKNHPISPSVLKNLASLYGRLRQHRPSAQKIAWSIVIAAMKTTPHGLANASRNAKPGSIQAQLCQELIPSFGQPLPDIDATACVKALLEGIAPFKSATTDVNSHEGMDQENLDDKEEIKKFKKGDSIGKYIRAKSEFLLRSQRLGMGSPRTVPHAQIKSAILQLLERIQSSGLMNREADGELLCLLQLNLPLPLHVLLRTPIGQGPDVSLDLMSGCICFDRDQLISRRFDDRKTLGLLQIPIPVEVKKALEARNAQEQTLNGQLFIGDLFIKEGDTAAEYRLKRLHEQALQRAYEKTSRLAPGKWVDSIPSLYLHTLGNDTLAAICSISPGLCNPGVLHYANPSPQLIGQAIHQVFNPLGFGDIEPLTLETSSESEIQKYPSDASIHSGINHLVQEAKHAIAALKNSTRPDELVKNFNTCAGIACALLLISVTGRATKIQELNWGSLLASEELLHINDKNIRGEEGSRLIAKTPLNRWAINAYMQALHRAEQSLSHHRMKVIFAKEADRKLSSFHFSKSAFVSLELKSNEIQCNPITAKVIESITTKTFGFHKNFMRHALINHWYESKLDPLLLRSITGHARVELEAPCISCSYSPKSLIMSAGKDLAQIFKKWTPSSLTPALLPPTFLEKISHQHLQNAFIKSKKQIQNQREGITYTAWHLLAEKVTKAIQTKLISSHPTDSIAHLWLMLVCIDGITDKQDLSQIVSTFNLEQAPRGWFAKWVRVGYEQYFTQILQASTARLLCSIQKPSTPIELTEVTEKVDLWLRQQSRRDPLLHQIFTSKKSPHATLLECASLYLDLIIPTALQYCNQSTSSAAHINVASVLKLMRHTDSEISPPLKRVIHYKSKAGSLNDLDGFISIINELGDNTKNSGEQRKRASKYETASTASGLPNATGWAKDLDLVVRFNCKLIKTNQTGKIEFSSLRTYISHLKYYFYETPEIPPNIWDEESAKDMAMQLFELPPSDKKILDDKKIEDRLKDQHAAAAWLLRSLRALGYYIPFIFPKEDGITNRASAICFVSKEDLLKAKNVLSSSTSTELERIQAQLALDLLSCAPMRWMECATLEPKHLIQNTNDLRIESTGFSQLKTYSSRRHIRLPVSVANKFTQLAQRIQEMEFTSSHFLFFKSTDKTSANAAKANWINRTIQEALAQSTGDPTFRVHHLRANRICEIIYPSLEKHLELWQKNPESHKKILSSYFSYSASNAWGVDQARSQAGHAHPRTTLTSYLFLHPIARSLAIGSNLNTDHLKKSIELITPTSEKENSEILKVSKLPPASKHLNPSHALDEPSNTGIPLTDELRMRITCRYWTHRLLGRSQTTVCDDLEISLQDARKLERILKSTQVWKISQKQLTASVKLDFENFENLLNALRPANNLELKSLTKLLKGNSKVEHWERHLKKIASYLSDHQLKLELVSNQRHIDLPRHAELALINGIEIGEASTNRGIKHQVFIHPSDIEISLKPRHGTQKTFIAITQSIFIWNSLNEKGGVDEK